MFNVLICGISGKMGEAVYNSCKTYDINVVCGVDKNLKLGYECPCYTSFDEVRENVDVIIDFSKPSALRQELAFAENCGAKIVCGTTGLSNETKDLLNAYRDTVAIFYSENMAIGLNSFIEGCVAAYKAMNDVAVEIIEKHHEGKCDAPSGTALYIAKALQAASNGTLEFSPSTHKRSHRNEIVFHSIRGGNIVGEHQVLLIGKEDVITLTHTAQSRNIFSEGAISAAEFMLDKKCGLFSMKDLINARKNINY